MPQDKNGVELKVGDTIRYEGVIGQIALQRIYTEQQDDQRQEVCFAPSLVEFVSRPEPTVSVELTLAELQSLRTISDIAGSRAYWKLVAARAELANA